MHPLEMRREEKGRVVDHGKSSWGFYNSVCIPFEESVVGGVEDGVLEDDVLGVDGVVFAYFAEARCIVRYVFFYLMLKLCDFGVCVKCRIKKLKL